MSTKQIHLLFQYVNQPNPDLHTISASHACALASSRPTRTRMHTIAARIDRRSPAVGVDGVDAHTRFANGGPASRRNCTARPPSLSINSYINTRACACARARTACSHHILKLTGGCCCCCCCVCVCVCESSGGARGDARATRSSHVQCVISIRDVKVYTDFRGVVWQ